MGNMLERLSAAAGIYQHNDLTRRVGEMEPDECANGHAHCQHLLLGGSENIPIADGRMELGRWQRIFLLELDRPRDRQLVVQVFGA
jgi:secondary thiamine-phosphate synthase enzyme